MPLLIFSSEQQELAVDLELPSDGDNLFQRLIRNPHIESDTPRERECAEMLCVLLRNTQQVRLHLLRWLAKLVNQKADDLNQLEFHIDTEGSIGSKRDDLRIEGWQVDADQQKLLIVWTLEIKVGAWFHESSLQESGFSPNGEEEAELVNQLVNYDYWLSHQPAERRAGFVLALEDLTSDLPARLSMPWSCFTWTSLTEAVIEALKSSKLPPTEELLARHFVGFVKKHLWRVSDMANDRIEFDDIALLRAFATMGLDCEKKIYRLVAQLIGMIDQIALGEGKISHQTTLFKSYLRSTVYRSMFRQDVFLYPGIAAGVEKDYVTVFLETSTSHALKTPVAQAIRSVHDGLLQRNSAWHVPSSEEKSWRDLELRLPLTNLLVADDQEGAFVEFFRRAFDDLKECDVVGAIRRELENVVSHDSR